MSGKGVVLHNILPSHDCSGRRICTALPCAVVCGPCHIHSGGRLCFRTCKVRDHKEGRSVWHFQLYLEFLSGRLHQRYVQLHSHICNVFHRALLYEKRNIDTTEWRRRRWKLLFNRLAFHRTDLNDAIWRELHWRSSSACEHQGVRLSSWGWLREFYHDIRQRKRWVSLFLLPWEQNRGSYPLQPGGTRAGDNPLFCCAVHRDLGNVGSALRHVLRLSVWDRAISQKKTHEAVCSRRRQVSC